MGLDSFTIWICVVWWTHCVLYHITVWIFVTLLCPADTGWRSSCCHLPLLFVTRARDHTAYTDLPHTLYLHTPRLPTQHTHHSDGASWEGMPFHLHHLSSSFFHLCTSTYCSFLPPPSRKIVAASFVKKSTHKKERPHTTCLFHHPSWKEAEKGRTTNRLLLCHYTCPLGPQAPACLSCPALPSDGSRPSP